MLEAEMPSLTKKGELVISKLKIIYNHVDSVNDKHNIQSVMLGAISRYSQLSKRSSRNTVLNTIQLNPPNDGSIKNNINLNEFDEGNATSGAIRKQTSNSTLFEVEGNNTSTGVDGNRIGSAPLTIANAMNISIEKDDNSGSDSNDNHNSNPKSIQHFID